MAFNLPPGNRGNGLRDQDTTHKSLELMALQQDVPVREPSLNSLRIAVNASLLVSTDSEGSTDGDSIQEITACSSSECHTHKDSYTKNFTRRLLPIESFNHFAREVADIEESLQFYRDIMGFVVIPRPPFEAEGYWLWGYGLALHIVTSRIPKQKRDSDLHRIEYLKDLLPRVDHMAFISKNIDYIKDTLVESDIFFFEEYPLGPEGHFRQLFFFDPDGNVLEISNCGPEVGKISCNELTVV